jgi:hypothetical protein
MSKLLTGKAYAFINCRRSKEDVRFYANDMKSFMFEDLKAQGCGPILDNLRLDVNQGLTALKCRGMRRFEAKAELLKTVMEAEEGGKIFTKPGSVPVIISGEERMHDFGSLHIIHAALANAPNLQVADELAAIVNNMYSASPLYVENEPFRGIITYLDRDHGTYVLRE